MGASGMGGGGRSANFELNLVPYIDLLSVIICFLLVTAVWQELESLSSQAPPKQVSEANENDTPTPPPPTEKKTVLSIAIGLERTDFAEDESIRSVPHRDQAPDWSRIDESLRDWRARYPDRRDVVLATHHKSQYQWMIGMMDRLMAQQFPEIGLSLN
jgi:biopolymer transport protein ExbD